MIPSQRPERLHSAPPAPRARTSRPGGRERILEAAITEFAEKNFQEASLTAIARRLGVTAPLVLYHFGSKANLWREALEVFCASLATVVDQAVADGRTLHGQDPLRLLVRRLVHFFAANRAAFRLLREQGCAPTREGERFATTSLRPVIAQIEMVYRRAVAEGVVRAAPFETTFFMILGTVSCYLESRALAAHLFGNRDESEHWIDEYADQVVAMCFEGLSAGAHRRQERRPIPPRRHAAAVTPEPEAALG